jgi:hypothetical protein
MRFVTRGALRIAEVERDIAAGFFVTAAASNCFARRLRSQRAGSRMDVVALLTIRDLVIRMHIRVTALATIASCSFGVVWVVAAVAQAMRLRSELPKRDLGSVARLATCNFGFFEHVRLVAANAFFVFADDDRGCWDMRSFDFWILMTTRAARRCYASFFVRLMTF